MITVKHYDHNLRVVSERTFENAEAVSEYYRNRKNPDDPEKTENGCWNCMNYDWNYEACTVNWNNMDPSYYNPDIDDRDPTDICDDFVLDPDAKPEDFDFRGNEP